MTLALALTMGPIVVGWWAPGVLRFSFHRVTDPLAILLGWLCALAAVLTTFVVGIGLLLAPGPGHHLTMVDLAHDCWLLARHGKVPALDEAIGAAGALLLLAALARFAAVTIRRGLAARRSRQAHFDLLALLGGPSQPRRGAVLWIPHAAPLAYSLGGPGGVTVLGTGARSLPPAQLAAVLSHEQAHLRGRHHLLVTVVEGLAAAVPWLPLTRQAPAAVRLLVELCADASAVQECGHGAVRAALTVFAGGPQPTAALSMAGGDVSLRLQRLQTPPPPCTALARTTTTVAALTAPVLAGLLFTAVLCN